MIKSGHLLFIMLFCGALGGLAGDRAQEIISANAALVSGLMLKFEVGIGGLGVGLIGILAERFGLAPAIQVLIWLPVLAGLLALGIKTICRE